MKNHFFPILILTLSSVLTSVITISAQTDHDISEISLKDSGGFRFDRQTEVRFSSDGSAFYSGGKNAYLLPGKYRGRIGKYKFAKLANLIVERGFFSFKDRYEKQANDAATVTTAVVYEGGQKTVANFAHSGGENLWAVERAVNALGLWVKWENIDTGISALSAEQEINRLLYYRDFSFDTVMQTFDFADFTAENDAAYEKLKNLTALKDKDHEIQTFFFRGKNLLMMYLTAEMLEKSRLTANDFYKMFGKKYVEMPSRAGESHRQIVYPKEGIAFSTGGEKLDFLEVFPPTSIAKYKSGIYQTIPTPAK